MKKQQQKFNEIEGFINFSHPSTKYTFEKKIGDGSASKIYICKENDTNTKVIIKRIHKKEEWKSELHILKLLTNTKKLLEFLDIFISDRFVYIVTKFYEGFDLFEHIDINVPLGEEYTRLLVREMAICIKECHDMGIAHLDIKCENYMVLDMNDPNLILIDFGHAEKIELDQYKQGFSKYGTSFYLCPEGYHNMYSFKSDTWSLGICIYLFLTGDYPFDGNDDDEYEYNSKNCNILTNKTFLKKNISKEATELIMGCLQVDYKKRLNIEQVLNSSFLKLR